MADADSLLSRGETRASAVFSRLRDAGWREDRVSGSHHIFKRAGRACLPVAVHGGKLRRDVVRHILRNAGLQETASDEVDGRPADPIETAAAVNDGRAEEPVTTAAVTRPARGVTHRWVDGSEEERTAFRLRALQLEADRREAAEELQAAVDAAQHFMLAGDYAAVEPLLAPFLPSIGRHDDLDALCARCGYETTGDALFFLTQAAVLRATGEISSLASVDRQDELARAVRLCKALLARFVRAARHRAGAARLSTRPRVRRVHGRARRLLGSGAEIQPR